MESDKISMTYARSLSDLAEEKKVFPAITEDVEGLEQLLKHDNNLLTLLDSPGISQEDKLKTLDKLFKGQVHDYTLNFLKVLLVHRRQNWLPAILRQFHETAAVKHGKQTVKVTYAREADKETSQKFKDVISAKVKEQLGSDALIQETTDASLLGGSIIKIGDLRVDMSLKTKLQSMTKNLKKTQFNTAQFIEE